MVPRTLGQTIDFKIQVKSYIKDMKSANWDIGHSRWAKNGENLSKKPIFLVNTVIVPTEGEGDSYDAEDSFYTLQTGSLSD